MKSKLKSRAVVAGEMLANAVMEAAHLTYNAPRGRRMVEACIRTLEERIGEIQPKEADLAYKEARYGKGSSKKKLKK